jgi:hypothetical protein
MRKRMKDTELKTYVSKLNQKRESLLSSLLKLEEKRRDAQQQLERRMRKRAKEAATPIEPTLSDSVSDICSRMIQGETFEQAEAAPPLPKEDDLDIPGYLKRDSNEQTNRDAEAAAEIRAQIAAKKKEAAERAATKRKIKRDMIKADLTGATRRMPLEGKAALAAINKR